MAANPQSESDERDQEDEEGDGELPATAAALRLVKVVRDLIGNVLQFFRFIFAGLFVSLCQLLRLKYNRESDPHPEARLYYHGCSGHRFYSVYESKPTADW